MGDKDDGFSEALLQVEEFTLQFGASDGIEGAERFVHEEDGRIGRQRARYAHSLALATGKFAGIARGDLGIESD